MRRLRFPPGLAHGLASWTVLTALTACGGARPTPAPAPRAGDRAALAAEQNGRVVQGTVGIPPFAASKADTTLTPLAYALADLVSTDLSRSGKVRIVERARFAEVLRELDLVETGRVDSATAPRVGHLVSAQRLIFGNVDAMPDGRTLRLGARVGDVERATVSRAVDATAPLAEILAAEKQLVFRLFESLGVTLTPAERAAIEATPTRNLSALLAYGRGVQRWYEGDYRGANRAFRDATRLDPNFKAAAERSDQVRMLGAVGTATPVTIPGVRPLDGAISTTVDRLNRPLDLTVNVSRNASTAVDAGFPSTQATVIIKVGRP